MSSRRPRSGTIAMIGDHFLLHQPVVVRDPERGWRLRGRIVAIHDDHTYDVLLDGPDPEGYTKYSHECASNIESAPPDEPFQRGRDARRRERGADSPKTAWRKKYPNSNPLSGPQY